MIAAGNGRRARHALRPGSVATPEPREGARPVASVTGPPSAPDPGDTRGADGAKEPWTVIARWVGAVGICERRIEAGRAPEAAKGFCHPEIAEGRAMEIAGRVINHERRNVTLALRDPRARSRGSS